MTAMDILRSLDYLDDELIANEELNFDYNRRKRITRPVFIAAILLAGILLISACAVSGGADKFLQYFSEASPGKLSAEQMDYIVANTVDVNRSKTVNGYTLTLKSIFSDGRDILIQFDLFGPKGAVLNADGYREQYRTVLESDSGTPLGIAMEWKLQDEDRTDNHVALLYSIESAWISNGKFLNQNCRLYIYGLEAFWHENMGVRVEPLTEGCWDFEIYFPEDCDRYISFIDDPVTVTQTVIVGYDKVGKNELQAVTEEMKGEIVRLDLRALGAELAFRFGEESRNAKFGDLNVVTKNGKKIVLKQNFGMPDLITYKVETPIILDQVDYILLDDGTKLQAP